MSTIVRVEPAPMIKCVDACRDEAVGTFATYAYRFREIVESFRQTLSMRHYGREAGLARNRAHAHL